MNFNNNEIKKVINHASTRWLSLGKCLERTLMMQWDSLKSYFLSNFYLDDDPFKNNMDKKPSREKRLVNTFKQPVSKLYTMFIIPIFDAFNTFLQAEEPLSLILFHFTVRFHRPILSRFILPEVISKSDWTKYSGVN